jgi:hypothetical protein
VDTWLLSRGCIIYCNNFCTVLVSIWAEVVLKNKSDKNNRKKETLFITVVLGFRKYY